MTGMFHKMTLATLALLAMMPPPAHANPLPPLINFQSVLLDEGGNLLPPGPTTIQFQILDENREPIYTETQSPEVVQGAVSALIGNGSDDKGITTGGIPDEIFTSGAPRYLRVQVGNQLPEEPMTIVPVPYAQWSQVCATVAKAAVGFEQLAPEVISKLATETAQTLGGSSGATQVGVDAKFINSGNSNVQSVLQDIDLAVKKRQEEGLFLTGKLNQEVTNRTNTVKAIQDKLATAITSEQQTRAAADSSLQSQMTTAITSEQQTRAAADSSLQSQMTKEISDRNAGDASLQSQLNQEITTRAASDNTFSNSFATKLYVDSKIVTFGDSLPPPNPAAALIKFGAYSGGTGNLSISVGFKPIAVKIISPTNQIEYFGMATDASTITGMTTSKSTTNGISTIQLSGTTITIPSSGGNINLLNYGSGNFFYTIWGTL